MTQIIPANTTRPLFHIAAHYGADYSDVLQVADGIKALITGGEVREAWFPPALDRICRPEYIGGRDEPALYEAIRLHVTDFVALQNARQLAERDERRRMDGIVLDEGFVHKGP